MTLPQMATPMGLAGLVVKGTLLLAVGWFGALLLRRAPAVARHLVWLTVIVGVLLIPVLVNVAPMNVAVLPSTAPTATPSHSRDVRSADVRARVESIEGASTMGSGSVSPATERRSWMPNSGAIALAVWLTVALVLLARLLAGMLSVGRIIRRGNVLHSTEWTAALAEAATRLELKAAPRLVMSDQVEMAFAFDALTPTIIVPVSADEWSDDRRRAVLLHELAHIRRRDLIGHVIASVACAVYWFNPFVWVAARRLRVESELASDDVVLDSGVRPSEYAQHLLDLVTSVGQRAPSVALAMARPKEFEGRLVAILDRANRRHGLGRSQGTAMVGLLGLLTVSIAAVVPVPRAPNAARMVAAIPPIEATALPPRDTTAPVRAVANANPAPPKLAPALADAAPRLSDLAIATLLRFGTPAIVNPMMMILRDADSLGLSGRQADSIATLSRWYMVQLNGIWSPVSSYYVSHGRGPDDAALDATFRRAPRASMDLLIGLAPEITGLLTTDQRRKLSPQISSYLDAENLAAIGAGRTSAPGGVFFPDGGLYGARGARGGGRRGGA
jgi:beta-lactamase regulating signal transducer with metallopeptidase domain